MARWPAIHSPESKDVAVGARSLLRPFSLISLKYVHQHLQMSLNNFSYAMLLQRMAVARAGYLPQEGGSVSSPTMDIDIDFGSCLNNFRHRCYHGSPSWPQFNDRLYRLLQKERCHPSMAALKQEQICSC